MSRAADRLLMGKSVRTRNNVSRFASAAADAPGRTTSTEQWARAVNADETLPRGTSRRTRAPSPDEEAVRAPAFRVLDEQSFRVSRCDHLVTARFMIRNSSAAFSAIASAHVRSPAFTSSNCLLDRKG